MYFAIKSDDPNPYTKGTSYSYRVKKCTGKSGYEASMLQSESEVTPSPSDSPYGLRPDDHQQRQHMMLLSAPSDAAHPELEGLMINRVLTRGVILRTVPQKVGKPYFFVGNLPGARPWGRDVILYTSEIRPDHRDLVKDRSVVQFFLKRGKQKDSYEAARCTFVDSAQHEPRRDDRRGQDALSERFGGDRRDRHQGGEGREGHHSGEGMDYYDPGRKRKDRFSPPHGARYSESHWDSPPRQREPRRSFEHENPHPRNDSYNVLIPDLMKGDIVEVLAVSEGRYPPQWQPPHRTGWVRVKKGYVSVWVPDYILVNVPRSAERKRGKAQKPPSAKKKAPKKAQKKAVVKNGKPNPANMKKVEKKLESRNMRDTSPSPTLS
ncbi:hypothetical protein TrRE_jg2962 [Triparma retinervis]|uniref:Uncharacterized protein n=1 Tax=Triparma retinervis TaxID=2557542 RepID=A0A9W7AZY1_9STRA|nr:hypothetical protein TrRE_jg2962 [Triparma retinervis]